MFRKFKCIQTYVISWFSACTCDLLGTINNAGCNVLTGECSCKRFVTGRDCNQCLPQHYGLSEHPDGCQPCNCDRGGALDNNCDVHTGQCKWVLVIHIVLYLYFIRPKFWLGNIMQFKVKLLITCNFFS